MSIEIYRIMHDGNLPESSNISVNWIIEFLDKQDDIEWWANNIMTRNDWGSLYLTAKRMVYRFADQILETI